MRSGETGSAEDSSHSRKLLLYPEEPAQAGDVEREYRLIGLEQDRWLMRLWLLGINVAKPVVG